MSAAKEAVFPSAAPRRLQLEGIKAKQQATWASGDFAVIGTTLQIVGEQLAESADICAGDRVLDVAAGNGNATLAAARRFASVVSTDYVDTLLAKGAARAEAEGLQVTFEVADAEALPYGDATFDAVLSTFGVMFAPDHRAAANELLRVTRGGGRIGLASWTPEGFIGELFNVIAKFVAPPAGVASPMLWGSEDHVFKLFAREADDIHCTRRVFNFRYRSAAHWIDVFRRWYGPTHKAFLALDERGQRELEGALTKLLERRNLADASSLVVPGEYLEAVIFKSW